MRQTLHEDRRRDVGRRAAARLPPRVRGIERHLPRPVRRDVERKPASAISQGSQLACDGRARSVRSFIASQPRCRAGQRRRRAAPACEPSHDRARRASVPEYAPEASARFASALAIEGSMRLAIHPTSVQPSAAIARALSSAWLMQPRRRPTTRITGNSSARTRSTCISESESGTDQPPTPSTTTRSADRASCS